ncbi:hypothetical protein [Streptomyces virginiae]|uniref:hypothetical protein n=1 Tax=Streptomyces virginiae TaxID=1961 RepID=UPI0033200449
MTRYAPPTGNPAPASASSSAPVSAGAGVGPARVPSSTPISSCPASRSAASRRVCPSLLWASTSAISWSTRGGAASGSGTYSCQASYGELSVSMRSRTPPRAEAADTCPAGSSGADGVRATVRPVAVSR